MAHASFSISEPKKFFISYKDDSGIDCATHLYESLRKKGVDVFISCEDIEYDITRGPWREQVDKALSITKIFILIITATASTSSEIIREIGIVKDKENVEKYAFIHKDLWDNPFQTTFRLPNGVEINIKDYNAHHFGNPPELLRKVYNTIPLIQQIEIEKLHA
jgi:hypothetical protein